MSVPTDEEIERWRERWIVNDILSTRIAEIIKGSKPAGNDWGEAAERMWKVNKLIEDSGDTRFSVYNGIGESYILQNIKVPILDLRGINWSTCDLRFIQLPFARLDGSKLFLAKSHGAMFWHTVFNKADLTNAYLQGADFRNAELIGAKFEGAEVGKYDSQNYEHNIIQTNFSKNVYLPKYIENFKFGFWREDFWRFLNQRWFYTDFTGVKIEEADTTLAPDLKRYVEDQRFVARLKETSPVAYHVWNWTTACGWSTVRLLFWAILVIIIFAALYSLPWGVSVWWANILDNNSVTRLLFTDQSLLMADTAKPEGVPAVFHWFYISFDIFSNLGIRVATKPATWLGVIVVFFETILGWFALGLAITVFANKYSRRS